MPPAHPSRPSDGFRGLSPRRRREREGGGAPSPAPPRPAPYALATRRRHGHARDRPLDGGLAFLRLQHTPPGWTGAARHRDRRFPRATRARPLARISTRCRTAGAAGPRSRPAAGAGDDDAGMANGSAPRRPARARRPRSRRHPRPAGRPPIPRGKACAGASRRRRGASHRGSLPSQPLRAGRFVPPPSRPVLRPAARALPAAVRMNWCPTARAWNAPPSRAARSRQASSAAGAAPQLTISRSRPTDISKRASRHGRSGPPPPAARLPPWHRSARPVVPRCRR